MDFYPPPPPAVGRVWLQEDQDKLPADAGITGSPIEFNVRRRHVRHALANTNDSSPGPDGIPFLVWRRLRELGVTYLYEAIKEMVSEGGVENMRRDYPDFNASLLIFLPKKASGTPGDGTAYYNANGVRPLNITNTDNRILANVIRHIIEPIMGPTVTANQRGFISKRSMLANLVDVDEAMMESALTGGGSAALFFDFAAAFLSVEHSFMSDLFASRGWSEGIRRFVHILYQNNYCDISLKHKLYFKCGHRAYVLNDGFMSCL